MSARRIIKRISKQPTVEVESHAESHVEPHVESHDEPVDEPHVESHIEPHIEPIKVETRGRKKKYNTDEDRINARKLQQKRYRDRQKEKVKELLALVDGLTPEDIAELKALAQELRDAKQK